MQPLKRGESQPDLCSKATAYELRLILTPPQAAREQSTSYVRVRNMGSVRVICYNMLRSEVSFTEVYVLATLVLRVLLCYLSLKLFIFESFHFQDAALLLHANVISSLLSIWYKTCNTERTQGEN